MYLVAPVLSAYIFMSLKSSSSVFFFFLSFVLLGQHLQHMEVPRLGVESELLLLAYARATATSDPSCICNLYYSSQQCQILNPLSKVRDRTCNLIIPSRIRFYCAMMGTIYVIVLEVISCRQHILGSCFYSQAKSFFEA